MRFFRVRKKNGTWVWWASWTQNKRTRRRSTRCSNIDAAKLVGARWERERADPELAKARQATLGSEAVNFLSECRAADLAKGTISMYEQKLANVCDELGRDTSMADIDADMVARYFTTRDDEGAAESTQYKEWIALSGVLKLARHLGRFSREVASLKPPRLSADYKPRKVWLTWEQADMLLEELGGLARPERRRTTAYVLATGCRLGEWMRAGRIGNGVDIDWTRQVVHIHGTKTEDADQEIPIPEPMIRWLRLAGDPPFPHWSNARRDLHRACSLIERRLQEEWELLHGNDGEKPIFPRVTWNDLRRTFTSLLLQAGVPPHVLRHLTRHKTTAMIDLVYGQQTTAAVASLVEASLHSARSPSADQPGRGRRDKTRPQTTEEDPK